MSDLIDFVIGRHGGLQRWEKAASVAAEVHVHGGFWAYKGQPDLLGHQSVVADVHRQRISMTPFGAGRTLEHDQDADRVTVTDRDGQVIDELVAPRASMAGFAPDTPWTPAQTGYFISYATWTYLLEPFLFTRPGAEAREIEPWHEVGETWRRLEVLFPPSIASHSRVQTYYFDADTGLQRRVDYSPDVNGNPLVAHYTTEHRDFDGLIVPTRRRVLLRGTDGTPVQDSAAILLDIGDVRLRGSR
ncbi:hypothetical protein [Pseudonocardia lacus]|uniref:hypothetical protein n=1 Tax=Pseudonocardia lacus TaxID=2835865 RepID=UPI001BDC0E8A|nr:hypothetical protein [Pseudonocardia lacus]